MVIKGRQRRFLHAGDAANSGTTAVHLSHMSLIPNHIGKAVAIDA